MVESERRLLDCVRDRIRSRLEAWDFERHRLDREPDALESLNGSLLRAAGLVLGVRDVGRERETFASATTGSRTDRARLVPLVIVVLFIIAGAAVAVGVAPELMRGDWDRRTLIAVAVIGLLMTGGGLDGLRGVYPHRPREPAGWVPWFARLVVTAVTLGLSLWVVPPGMLVVVVGGAALAYGFGWAVGGVLRAIGSMIPGRR